MISGNRWPNLKTTKKRNRTIELDNIKNKLEEWEQTNTNGNKTRASKAFLKCYKNKNPILDLTNLRLVDLPDVFSFFPHLNRLI